MMLASPRNALPAPTQMLPSTRWPILIGALVILAGLGGFFAWAAFVPLDRGVVAGGQITGETRRQTVQHLDGGIISEILVRDGQTVQKGDVVIRLETVEDRVQVDALARRRANLMAREARLSTLRQGEAVLALPPELRELASADPEVAAMVATQERLFDSETQSVSGQLDLLRQRRRQQEVQIESLTEQRKTRDRQLALLQEEINDAEKLFAEQLIPKRRVLGLRREKASLDSGLADTAGRIEQAQERLNEIEMQIAVLERRDTQKWSEELATVQAEREQVEFKLVEAQNRLTRLEVAAPTTGTVMNLRYVTEGGVVAPGGPIMDIVPTDSALEIEVRIKPQDVDRVHGGQDARVRLAALPARTTPVVAGEVVRVSPDTNVDEQTGRPYYTARVRLAEGALEGVADADRLQPGMPAEVVIVAAQETLLDALVAPLEAALFRAFRS